VQGIESEIQDAEVFCFVSDKYWNRVSTTYWLFASMALLAAPAVFGQREPGFEVASIKPAPDLTELVRSHSPHIGVKIDGAFADFGAMSLDSLIQYAFRIKPFQLSGGGDPSARFDIMAKLPYGATPEEVPAMMHQLLVERFKLEYHWDSKQVRVYALVLRPKGATLARPPADFDRAADHALPLDRQVAPLTLDRLGEFLSPYFDRPVVNQTGLEGKFMIPGGRIVQAWPNRWLDRYEARRGGESKVSLPDTSRVIAILTELGLKLESRKAAFPVLVIDKLEKTPTEQ
jgi:uncharacterized protein (TIGR03435 family)